jgi:signal transduction histidine kinase
METAPSRSLLPRSLRARLLLSFLPVALLFFTALIALAFFAARDTLTDETGHRLADTAGAAAALMPSGLVARFKPDSARTHKNLVARLQRIEDAISARRVFLADFEGRLLADSDESAPPSGTVDPHLAQDRFELARVERGQRAYSVLYEADDGTRYQRGFAPIVHGEGDEVRVVAALGVEGSAGDYEAIDALGQYMSGVGSLALVALALVVIFVARAVAEPLRRLAGAAARIGAGRLDDPVRAARGPEEIAVLAKTMEEMRVALLQRERELQMMLGGIAHEVRNPLGGMELFVGLLREDLMEQPEQLDLLKRVETELSNLKRVVEEFLAYARQTPIDTEAVDLTELAFELSMLVDADVMTDGLADRTLQADRDQLRRLLLNLMRNAAQAGATGITVRWREDGLEIEDDGPGVPAEKAETIFDAFYTTREKGTGLGLALCRKIAEAHGGRLDLANPGEPGARFVVRLPG